jgi:hypothetical protein
MRNAFVEIVGFQLFRSIPAKVEEICAKMNQIKRDSSSTQVRQAVNMPKIERVLPVGFLAVFSFHDPATAPTKNAGVLAKLSNAFAHRGFQLDGTRIQLRDKTLRFDCDAAELYKVCYNLILNYHIHLMQWAANGESDWVSDSPDLYSSDFIQSQVEQRLE